MCHWIDTLVHGSLPKMTWVPACQSTMLLRANLESGSSSFGLNTGIETWKSSREIIEWMIFNKNLYDEGKIIWLLVIEA
jgi:hypothetical protein